MASLVISSNVGQALVPLTQYIEKEIQRVDKKLEEGARAILAESQALVPSDLGALRSSGRVEPLQEVGAVGWAVVYGGPTAPYAVYVHEGTRAPRKPPPPEALQAWVRRHFAVSDSEVKRIAYFIGQKIAKNGTPPVKYLEKPGRELTPGITASIVGF